MSQSAIGEADTVDVSEVMRDRAAKPAVGFVCGEWPECHES